MVHKMFERCPDLTYNIGEGLRLTFSLRYARRLMAAKKTSRAKPGLKPKVGILGWMARGLALAVLVWIGGFVVFVLGQAKPAPEGTRTEGVVVLTGGPGRVPRGVEVLKQKLASNLLISGVHPDVRPPELEVTAGIPRRLFDCCVELGFKAVSTRGNAEEVAEWVARHDFKTIRLVTAGYHMPRARAETEARLPADVIIVEDGVNAGLPLWPMLLEYAKFGASWIMLRVRMH